MAQWLGVCLPVQGTRVPSFAGGANIPRATEQLSPWTTTTEAWVPRACALQQEKPPQWEALTPQLERSPHLLQRDKACTQWQHGKKKPWTYCKAVFILHIYYLWSEKLNNFSKTTHSVNDLIKIAVSGCDLHKSNQRKGLSWWLSGKESSCIAGRKRYKFNPWVGKIPWKKAWQPTPAFLPGESYGQRSWQAAVHWVTKGQTEAT